MGRSQVGWPDRGVKVTSQGQGSAGHHSPGLTRCPTPPQGHDPVITPRGPSVRKLLYGLACPAPSGPQQTPSKAHKIAGISIKGNIANPTGSEWEAMLNFEWEYRRPAINLLEAWLGLLFGWSRWWRQRPVLQSGMTRKSGSDVYWGGPLIFLLHLLALCWTASLALTAPCWTVLSQNLINENLVSGLCAVIVILGVLSALYSW